MVLKNRIIAFIAGVLLGPAVVWAGLETGTYISDLVATNPLSSDLASTADDHIRLLKSTIKTTFPNINNAITVTDEQINAVGASGVTGAANPTGTIGLAAVNGSATTFLRSDGAPALSQAIAPTWTAAHTFTHSYNNTIAPILLSSAIPMVEWNETDAAANNRLWQAFANSEGWQLRAITDDRATAANAAIQIDRTGAVIDRVTFPTDGATAFVSGPVGSLSVRNYLRAASGSAVAVANTSAVSSTVVVMTVHNENTSGDNGFIDFRTEGTTGTSRGSIDYNRGATATRYNTTSDIRLKRNFKPAPSARALIECIQVESYDWKETGSHVDHGFVAQRLNKCAPYAVSSSTDPAKIWGVDPSKLVPALIKYVQEQDARITQQENRIRELEAHQTALLIKEVEELRNRMAKLEDEPRLIQFESVPAANRGSIQYNPAGGSVRYNIASDRRAK